MKTRLPQRLPWMGLVTLLLVTSLFVPVEASTPGLEPGTPEQAISHACSSEVIAPAGGYGTCNDINCCGGPPEAECRPGAA